MAAGTTGWAGTLSAEGLAAIRGERTVFRDVASALPPGAALVLTGPNGSGKSSLLRVLAGLLRPAAGRVAWNAGDIAEDPAAHARRIAYLGHRDAIKPGLTVAENLRAAERLSGGDAIAALRELGLAGLADLPARMLSAGQARRLALARVALSDRPVWLLDEPTLGLDAASVARLGGLLAAHRARGGSVAVATHLPLPLADAAELALA